MEFNATFLVSAISFIVFTLIMNKILYKPVSDIIKKRQAYLDDNALAVKNNLDNAKSIKDDKDKKVLEIKTVAKDKIMKEVNESKQRKSEQEAQKKSEMTNYIADKKQALSQEKEAVTQELFSETEKLSESIVDKLIGGES